MGKQLLTPLYASTLQKGMHEQLDVHELGSTVPMVAPLPKYTKMDKDNNTTNVDIH